MQSKASEEKIAKLLAAGRTSGKIRLAGLSLREVPGAVIDQEPIPGVAFWEEVPCTAVDVSRNEITDFPADLEGLSDLCTLNASHNQLAGLPDALALLSSLEWLDVSHNRLDNLAIHFSSSLRSLKCGCNRLKKIEIFPLPNLLQLSAEGNRLESVPRELLASRKLASLDLSNNSLSRWPQLQGLSMLEELKLSGNGMTGRVPPALSDLLSLTSVHLHGNGFEALPPDISGLSRLSELRLGANQLKELPEELGMLTQLHTLELADNQLQHIPTGIARLSLSLLDLRNNSLSSLPPELGLMSSLKAMPVSGNPLRGFRPSVLEGPLRGLQAALRHRLPEQAILDSPVKEDTEIERVLDALKQLSFDKGRGTLTLSNLQLSCISEEVWAESEVLKKVEKLDLSNNRLTQFPGEKLRSFEKLQSLVLAGNAIDNWPLPTEGHSLCLKELYLSRNCFADIPADAFATCAATLISLDLSGIAAVGRGQAAALIPCRSLQTLRLDGCGLSEVPSAVLQLLSLQTLSMTSNSLSKVPEEMTQLTALTQLDLSNNSLGALPPRLGLLQLQVLGLRGNPLRTIRRPILEKGCRAVMDHLRGRIPVA